MRDVDRSSDSLHTSQVLLIKENKSVILISRTNNITFYYNQISVHVKSKHTFVLNLLRQLIILSSYILISLIFTKYSL